MAGIQSILQAARAMGDGSSLSRGASGVQKRIGRRVAGGAAGKGMAGLSVVGLFMWAEFFAWVRNQIEAAAASDVWIGTIVSYAAGYEVGFTNPVGERRMRPYFFSGIRQARQRNFAQTGGSQVAAPSRSGLYVGNRFAADIRSIAKGRVGARVGRRAAGAETTKLFWGTLANPDKNVLMVLAREAQKRIRANITKQKLVETGALRNSIAIGESLKEMQRRSLGGVLDALVAADRVDEFERRTT